MSPFNAETFCRCTGPKIHLQKFIAKVHCKEWNLKEIPDCAIKKLAFQFDYKMAKLSGEYQIPPSLILNNVQALKLCHC